MKKILFTTLFLTVAMLMPSCFKSTGANQKKGSSGKALEILLVANKNVYNGFVKDSILAILHQPQECLNQPEQSFDVVNIPVSSLQNTEMFKAHRNIIIIKIADSNKNTVSMAKDRWAQPQVIFEFKINSRDSVAPYLRRYMPKIKKEVYDCEHARIYRAYRGVENASLMQKLRDNFGFDITVSNEYYLCNMKSDFAWLRKESRDFSIGVIIRTKPYTKTADFDHAVIMDQLDSTMKLIPGPVDSSYMCTERLVDALSNRVEFNDSYCVETRGLWRVTGKGFLSGPFVNYTLLAPDGENIVMITGYVQAPGKNKRDYLMQAESICYTLHFIDKKEK
ncbi:MAG: DUF4837 family protein [Bacteroidales bacterium]|nr:DUF4837 family protein [Bacteroidales bacterium]